jgi:hypothetical protein
MRSRSELSPRESEVTVLIISRFLRSWRITRIAGTMTTISAITNVMITTVVVMVIFTCCYIVHNKGNKIFVRLQMRLGMYSEGLERSQKPRGDREGE